MHHNNGNLCHHNIINRSREPVVASPDFMLEDCTFRAGTEVPTTLGKRHHKGPRIYRLSFHIFLSGKITSWLWV